MVDALTAAEATQAFANVQQYNRERPLREARLAEAKNRQRTSMLELNRAETLSEDQTQLELERIRTDLAQERRGRLQTETYRAFDTYEADGDPRHLNAFLQKAKSNPTGGMWQAWTRFDPVTRTSEVEAQLGQAGITDVDAFFSDPDLVKSKVLGTSADGEKVLLDLNRLYQATGYTQFADNRKLESIMARAKAEDLLRGQQSAETNIIQQIAESEGIGILDAAKGYYAAKNAGKTTGSTVERTAADLRAKDPSLGMEESLTQAARLIAAPSAAEKDINVTAGVRDRLHELAGGDFYSADLSNPQLRARAGELIVDLEKATGKKLSEPAKVAAKQLRSLSSLGRKAGTELSPDETGLVDNLLRKFKKYVSNDVGGVEAASSYETFRNVFRNALYGASLTSSETSAFEAAAGTLGQQLGPVLSQLKVQMEDVREQMRSIADFEDPMLSYYYLGKSQEDVLEAIQAIDERIELLDGYAKPKNIRYKPEPVQATPDGTKPNKPLSERWKEYK